MAQKVQWWKLIVSGPKGPNVRAESVWMATCIGKIAENVPHEFLRSYEVYCFGAKDRKVIESSSTKNQINNAARQ